MMQNIGVLSDCMVCGQDQLKIALHNLIHAIKEPYFTVKEAVEKIVPLVKKALNEVKQSANELKEQVVKIGN